MASHWLTGLTSTALAAAASELQGLSSCHLQQWVLPVVGVAIATAAFLFWASRNDSHQQLGQKSPPGPRNLPVIGAVFSGTILSIFALGLHKVFDKLAAQYGPILSFRLGGQNIVLVSSAELAEEVLKHNDAEFAGRKCLMTRLKGKFLGMDSTVFTFADYDAAATKLGRKIAITEFFTGAKLKSYEELRGEEMAVMVEKILLQINSSVAAAADVLKGNPRNQSDIAAASSTTVGIRQAATATVRNIICRLCVGKRFDDLPATDEFQKFPQLLDDHFKLFMTSHMMDFFPILEWLGFGVLKELSSFKKRQDEFFERLVERHRRQRKELTSGDDDNETSSKNFVDVLLRFQEEGGKMSDKGIGALLLTVLMGSIHTTSCQLEWIMLELARHPDFLKRLQAEIDGVVGKERAVQQSDVEAMPFLNAVLLETLRLHSLSPSSLPHVNTRPITIGGYDIPPHTAMIVNIRTLARDAKKWRNPLEFNPDRFMDAGSSKADPALSSGSVSVNGSNYNFLPFASGRRMCPGYSLAMVILSRMVATLVHAFDLGPPPGCRAQDLSTEEDLSYLLYPKPDLVLTCTPRLSRQVYKSNISEVKLTV